MQYKYRSEHESKDYTCEKELTITKYDLGVLVYAAQKEVTKETIDNKVHAINYIQRVKLYMEDDEAIKLRDKLIEAYPVKEQNA